MATSPTPEVERGAPEMWWTRVRRGERLVYLDEAGREITDAATLERLQGLAIPPAWEQVQIDPQGNAPVQARGRDSKGRTQRIYEPSWARQRQEAKHEHVLEVVEALPELRARIRTDLGCEIGERGPGRAQVLAAIATIIERSLARAGHRRPREDAAAYGITTLERRHVQVEEDSVTLSYVGKHQQYQHHLVVEADLARVCRWLLTHRMPAGLGRGRHGERAPLWWYRDESGTHLADADALNAYLREASGMEVRAKDLRTWGATVQAATAAALQHEIAQLQDDTDSAPVRTSACAQEVARHLGNTPTVARNSYIHPRVLELLEEGSVIALEEVIEVACTEGSPGDARGLLDVAVAALLLREPGGEETE